MDKGKRAHFRDLRLMRAVESTPEDLDQREGVIRVDWNCVLDRKSETRGECYSVDPLVASDEVEFRFINTEGRLLCGRLNALQQPLRAQVEEREGRKINLLVGSKRGEVF